MRYSLKTSTLRSSLAAVKSLGEVWRAKYFKIKYEFMATKLIIAQAVTRSIIAAQRAAHLKRCQEAVLAVQTSWRKRDISRKWLAIAKATIQHRATLHIQDLALATMKSAGQKVAISLLGQQLSAKLWQLRRRIRVQRHFKGFLARRHFQRTQMSLRNTVLAVSNVASFYTMQVRSRTEPVDSLIAGCVLRNAQLS